MYVDPISSINRVEKQHMLLNSKMNASPLFQISVSIAWTETVVADSYPSYLKASFFSSGRLPNILLTQIRAVT